MKLRTLLQSEADNPCEQAVLLPRIAPDTESEADYLARLTYERAEALYGEPLPARVAERLGHELGIIAAKGFARYFLLVQDYVCAARHLLGACVGPGRGSAGSSLVNYCLGITRIDPLEFDLLFERFISPDRTDLPDIDVEIDAEGRKKILQWMRERYGADNVVHISVYEQNVAGEIIGCGIHPCGVVVCGEPVEEHVPVVSIDDSRYPGKRLFSTQCGGLAVEKNGLVKLDLLDLDVLDEIKQAKAHGAQVMGCDLRDAATFRLFCEGDTAGIFAFDSAKMQEHLRALRPDTFEDLVALYVLHRPGSMALIPDFIARKHGRVPIEYPLDGMEQCLRSTYGLTIYQEQIMQLSRSLANFTPAESDALRRALAKRQSSLLAQFRAKFVAQGRMNGHAAAALEQVWTGWEAFAPFAFCKAHAIGRVLLAFQSAHLKAHRK